MPLAGSLVHDTSTNNPPPEKTNDVGGIAGDRVKSYVERVARIMEERKETTKAFSEDIKEIIAEAKGQGFDGKLIRKVAAEKVRRDNMDKDDLAEEEELLRIYFRAAGVALPPQHDDEDE